MNIQRVPTAIKDLAQSIHVRDWDEMFGQWEQQELGTIGELDAAGLTRLQERVKVIREMRVDFQRLSRRQ